MAGLGRDVGPPDALDLERDGPLEHGVAQQHVDPDILLAGSVQPLDVGVTLDPQPPRVPADRIEPHVKGHLTAGVVDIQRDRPGRVIEIRVADVPLPPAPHQWRLCVVPAARVTHHLQQLCMHARAHQVIVQPGNRIRIPEYRLIYRAEIAGSQLQQPLPVGLAGELDGAEQYREVVVQHPAVEGWLERGRVPGDDAAGLEHRCHAALDICALA